MQPNPTARPKNDNCSGLLPTVSDTAKPPKRSFGDPDLDPNAELKFEDERLVKIAFLVNVGGRVTYQYDFGDDWLHDIRVEKALAVDHRLTYPLCVGGTRACPPEDCGGPFGYEHLLEVLAKNCDDCDCSKN